MTENKLIIKSTINDLDKRIKRISEKCVDLLEKNRNLKSELTHKTQECEELSSRHSELVSESNRLRAERNRYKKQYRKNRLDRKQAEQKLEKIRKIAITCDDDAEGLTAILGTI